MNKHTLGFRVEKYDVTGCLACIMYVEYFFFQLASTVLIGPWPSLMDFSIQCGVILVIIS
jgi:hypothetical protein